MNPNRLINDIKQELGIGTFISTRYSDYDLLNIVTGKTRMTFSRIYGYDWYIPHIKFEPKDRYNSRFMAYRIPDFILKELEFEKSGVIDVRYLGMAPSTSAESINGNDSFYRPPAMTPFLGSATGLGSGYWGGSESPTYYMQGMSQMVGIAQVGQAMEFYRKPLKARFKSPNIIEFDPRGMHTDGVDFELRIKVGHARNLSTIDEPHYYIFKKLAIYDIKEFLWNTELKGLDGLSNGYDNISLKIDDWAEAANQRDEYIKELEQDIVLLEGITVY